MAVCIRWLCRLSQGAHTGLWGSISPKPKPSSNPNPDPNPNLLQGSNPETDVRVKKDYLTLTLTLTLGRLHGQGCLHVPSKPWQGAALLTRTPTQYQSNIPVSAHTASPSCLLCPI